MPPNLHARGFVYVSVGLQDKVQAIFGSARSHTSVHFRKTRACMKRKHVYRARSRRNNMFYVREDSMTHNKALLSITGICGSCLDRSFSMEELPLQLTGLHLNDRRNSRHTDLASVVHGGGGGGGGGVVIGIQMGLETDEILAILLTVTIAVCLMTLPMT